MISRRNFFKRFQLLYMPIIVSIVSFFMIAVISYKVSSNFMRAQMIDNSIGLSELLSGRIQNELESNDQQINHITEMSINVGNYILNNRELISNKTLAEMANTFDIDHIYYYQSDGVLTNTCNDSNDGWFAQKNDTIHTFLKGTQSSYIEDVKKDVDDQEFYRFVYVKGIDGDFVKLGIKLKSIEHLNSNLVIQSIIERVIKDDAYFVYSLVTNENLVAIADTDLEDVGIDYSIDAVYLEALKGETVIHDWFYPKLDETVIEVVTPLFLNDKIAGVVVIGVSQSLQKSRSLFLAGIIFIITFLIVLNYMRVQYKNVVKPIKKLYWDINEINPESLHTALKYDEDGVFHCLYESIENLLNRLRSTNQRVASLNHEISELAYLDYLTKLPNRFSFKKEFENFVKVYPKVATVLIDLNNFKEYNDIFGHSFGDDILVLLSERLIAISNANLFASRLGGDEFMLAVGFNDDDELLSSIKQIEKIFSDPVVVNDELLQMEASIGISVYPDDSIDFDELMTFSDLAMYSIKTMDEVSYTFFKNEMKASKSRNVAIKRLLNDAINNDGFKLLYQPIIDLKNNLISNYEGLLRFKNHNVYPDEFIPIAESTGLIIPIGRYVIESAIKQVAQWKAEKHICTRVSINFSTKQFYDDKILEFIEEKLMQHGVLGECLIIEITETFLLEKSINDVKNFIGKLKELGIKVAMDDFGTGYTSVLLFNEFPFDAIKLDRGFVERNLNNSDDVFNSWLSLFRAYSFKVVAEGVETIEQLDRLKSIGVDFAQGYYFSKPVSPEELSCGVNLFDS